MEAIELIEIITRGEDSYSQFKENITNPASFAGDLVAFSNSNGGRIIIGVDDEGVIAGLTKDDIRRLNQLISNASTNLVHPSINPVTENILTSAGLIVMVVTVPEGISKPYSDNQGVFWVKSGADKRRVTSREEIQRMFQSVDLVHGDEIPVEGTTSSDIDSEHFNIFFEKAYGESVNSTIEKSNMSINQLLNNLGLAHVSALNLAGLMIFGKHPQRYRPAFVLKAVSFVGNDPAGEHYRDSQDIEGCLRDLYRGTMSFLARNLRYTQNSKGFNTQGEPEIPTAALEELIVNMLLHRDYFISAPWRVMIFDDRVELISPGALPNSITVENIKNGVSMIRNPLLASFATKDDELPYRGIGTGIRRALAVVSDLELESDSNRNLFTARIHRKAF